MLPLGLIKKALMKKNKKEKIKLSKLILIKAVINMVIMVAISFSGVLLLLTCAWYIIDGDDVKADDNPVAEGEATGWWWPIGSAQTTTENGKLFASGEPELGASNVTRVGPNGGSKWGITANAHEGNLGLDIGAGGQINKYYVISVGNGTVTKVFDNVPENTLGTSPATNGGCGNYVEVDYGEIIVRYLHLYHESIQVKTGDTVDYGQVLGKIGLNGDTTGAHSHTDYKDKDGNWLDPVDIVDPNNPRPTSSGGVIGDSIQDKVWFTLTGAGYSEYAVAGVMGNISGESSWDPKNINSSSGAKGLCQWYDRGPALENYAKSKGTDWKDVDTQIEFLLGELNPNGGADGYATFQGSGHKSEYNEWKGATSPEDAAYYFRIWFERCGESEAHDDRRKEEAKKFYNQYHGKTLSNEEASGNFKNVETVAAAGYTFPHYLQRNYNRRFGSSTIATAGCGPTSLSMILAGLTNNSKVNPVTLVDNLEEYYNGSYSQYYCSDGTIYSGLCNTRFLKKYYNCKSTAIGDSDTTKAYAALEAGKCIIARENGHVLALIPVPKKYKNEGYKFYIMDSGRGHDGPYKSIQDANNRTDGGFAFKYIIEPST